jgi:hypothetical protein
VIIGSSHPRDHDLSLLAIPITKIVVRVTVSLLLTRCVGMPVCFRRIPAGYGLRVVITRSSVGMASSRWIGDLASRRRFSELR